VCFFFKMSILESIKSVSSLEDGEKLIQAALNELKRMPSQGYRPYEVREAESEINEAERLLRLQFSRPASIIISRPPEAPVQTLEPYADILDTGFVIAFLRPDIISVWNEIQSIASQEISAKEKKKQIDLIFPSLRKAEPTGTLETLVKIRLEKLIDEEEAEKKKGKEEEIDEENPFKVIVKPIVVTTTGSSLSKEAVDTIKDIAARTKNAIDQSPTSAMIDVYVFPPLFIQRASRNSKNQFSFHTELGPAENISDAFKSKIFLDAIGERHGIEEWSQEITRQVEQAIANESGNTKLPRFKVYGPSFGSERPFYNAQVAQEDTVSLTSPFKTLVVANTPFERKKGDNDVFYIQDIFEMPSDSTLEKRKTPSATKDILRSEYRVLKNAKDEPIGYAGAWFIQQFRFFVQEKIKSRPENGLVVILPLPTGLYSDEVTKSVTSRLSASIAKIERAIPDEPGFAHFQVNPKSREIAQKDGVAIKDVSKSDNSSVAWLARANLISICPIHVSLVSFPDDSFDSSVIDNAVDEQRNRDLPTMMEAVDLSLQYMPSTRVSVINEYQRFGNAIFAFDKTQKQIHDMMVEDWNNVKSQNYKKRGQYHVAASLRQTWYELGKVLNTAASTLSRVVAFGKSVKMDDSFKLNVPPTPFKIGGVGGATPDSTPMKGGGSSSGPGTPLGIGTIIEGASESSEHSRGAETFAKTREKKDKKKDKKKENGCSVKGEVITIPATVAPNNVVDTAASGFAANKNATVISTFGEGQFGSRFEDF